MTASRVPTDYAPGSLLKAELTTKRKTGVKRGRQTDKEHLACVRKLPCAKCGIAPAGEAAHVRKSTAGKPVTGMGTRPDDCFTVPLCRDCHAEQHRDGETHFWSNVGINPLHLAEKLYRLSPNQEAMRAVVIVEAALAATE